MKLSCLPVSYYNEFINGKKSIISWAEEASRLGLNGIDISQIMIKSMEHNRICSIKESINNIGIHVAMFATYTDFTNPEKKKRKKQLMDLERDFETAACLGADLIRLTAGQNYPGISKDDGIKWVLEGLNKAEIISKKYPVDVVFENHGKPGIWDYTDFAHDKNIFLAIVKKIESMSIGINFDTANPVINCYSSIDLLKKIIHKVVSVHAADNMVYGKIQPVIIGKGIVPFNDIFKHLVSAQFNGWICIEEASGCKEKGVKEAVTYIKKYI